ncbi:MAG: hypothetical protein ACRDS9_13090 [Pseudonocardiaceae bacterium]
MNEPTSAALHEVYGEELTELLDLLLASTAVTDWAEVERRLVRSVAALIRLHDLHRLDERGRCSVCWPVSRHWWRPWPKRSTCTVHSTLRFYLRQPYRFVVAALGHSFGVRGTS